MPKNKPIYVCTDCGYESAKWMGRCPSCGAWNKMEEQAPAAPAPAAAAPQVVLEGVDETQAACVMAIVSHETGIPLDQLVFKSIKAV